MQLAELQARVRNLAMSSNAPFDLDPTRVHVEYVVNRGGFGNPSFRVRDGRLDLRLKLTDEPNGHVELERWRRFRDVLERRYLAPPMIGWLAIPGTAFEGPVFSWIEGSLPDPLSLDQIREILPTVERLHTDRDLAEKLDSSDQARLCSEVYRDTYHKRFTEDLKVIRPCPPSFISSALLDWMGEEAERLLRRVERSSAFDNPATSPIHGDLWADNLLIARSDRWYILDWDSLQIGDPALDLAMLLGPCTSRLRPLRPEDLPTHMTGAAALRDRLDVYLRAALLDWVIDVLADYVDADTAPEHAEAVRAEKLRLHHQALSTYEALYGRIV